MDMGKPNGRRAAEVAIRSKARQVVVVTGYKRAVRSRRRRRTSTSPAGALQVARVAEESERAFLLRWADKLDGGER
jgi:CTP:molybdopterin cytidylyltransferase MocA